MYVKHFTHPAFISALEMNLAEINGDGDCRVSEEMVKKLDMQEIMTLPPVCHTAC